MKYLLDTHILLWMTTEDERLKTSVHTLLKREECVISVGSLWEAAIKFSIGKLKLDGGLKAFLDEANKLNFLQLEIRNNHLLELNQLPHFDFHKDPFDRLLIAQAKAENLTIITADSNFKHYNIKILFIN